MYTFNPVMNDCNVLLNNCLPGIDDLSGTLDDAIEFSKTYKCKVNLYDDHGFYRGYVDSDNYRIQ